MSNISRVARKPVTIPSGIDVRVVGQQLAIKGPKGQVTLAIHPYIQVGIEDSKVQVSAAKDTKTYCRSGSGSKLLKSIPGTARAAIYNAVHGVSKGFERKLVLVGVGYRAQAKGKGVTLSIGFSHQIEFAAPEGITIETPSQTEIVIKGVDKHLVGHTASMIRSYRSPEPYKGKGIRYSNEIVIQKETKKK